MGALKDVALISGMEDELTQEGYLQHSSKARCHCNKHTDEGDGLHSLCEKYFTSLQHSSRTISLPYLVVALDPHDLLME